MKNKLTIKTLGALGLAILMGSCSTSNEVASGRLIQKRKVNSGFHINWPSNWKNADSNQELAQKEIKNEAKTEIAVESVAAVETVTPSAYVVESADQVVASTENNVLAEQVIVSNETFTSSNEEVSSAKSVQLSEKQLKKAVKKAVKKNNKKSSGGEVPKWALIVLAFFIPWLAVGLATDWDIMPIIYNLLWTLLCGIPGIIHAIIVVNREA